MAETPGCPVTATSFHLLIMLFLSALTARILER
jgi:hypothetical protein